MVAVRVVTTVWRVFAIVGGNLVVLAKSWCGGSRRGLARFGGKQVRCVAPGAEVLWAVTGLGIFLSWLDLVVSLQCWGTASRVHTTTSKRRGAWG